MGHSRTFPCKRGILAIMTKHKNNGIRKFCACNRKDWARCGCPWHFSFKGHRVSLNKHFGKPPGYKMSKMEAEKLRDQLRTEIHDGRFPSAPVEEAPAVLTFGDVADAYLKTYVRVPNRSARSTVNMECYVRILKNAEVPVAKGTIVRLMNRPMEAITKADVEAVRIWRREQLRRPDQRVGLGTKNGEIGIEHLMRTLRHMFNWAIAEGYVDGTPFKRHGVSVIKVKSGLGNPRTRRLNPGEEELLLAHASAHLKALIIAALETGCRVGELLSLQWREVRWTENVILLLAAKTKTSEARDLPMTAKLRDVLEGLRRGPDGIEHDADRYVFGNEVGEKVGRVATAWSAACRRAGITNLHFHDLRREFASRLLESGAADHDVRDWLGHANITTTSRYLSTTRTRLQSVSKRFEAHRGTEVQSGL